MFHRKARSLTTLSKRSNLGASNDSKATIVQITFNANHTLLGCRQLGCGHDALVSHLWTHVRCNRFERKVCNGLPGVNVETIEHQPGNSQKQVM